MAPSGNETNAFWQNETVLITGASRGIGREIARMFATKGAKIAVNYVSNEEQALGTIEGLDPERARVYRADVGNRQAVDEMIAKVESELGPVTILINNAGITRDGLLMTMSDDDWRAVMSTHLDGAFYCTRAVLPQMLRRRRGRVINVSSVSGVKGTAGQTNYSAAKAGLIGFTKALAREMGKKNITSNAIVVGVVDTEMTAVLSPEVAAAYKAQTSLKRFARPQEIAELAVFLSSPAADYITGQAITIDGGML